jgi:CHAT domain-containing protein
MLQAIRVLFLLITLAMSAPAAAFVQQQLWSFHQSHARQNNDEAALHALVQDFFAAYTQKTLEPFLALWNTKSPELQSRRLSMPRLFAEHAKIELKSLQIDEVSFDGDKATVRYELELIAIEAATNKPAAGFERSSRILQSVKEDGKWMVWRDSSVEEDLALRLIDAETKQDREALMNAEKDLVTLKLRRALITQARQQSSVSNYPRALTIFRIAKAVAERIGDKEGNADVLLGFAQVQMDQGDFTAALENFQSASTQYEEVGNKEYVAFALNQIGNIHRRQGDYERALQYTEKSLAVAEANGLRDVTLSTLMSLGNVYYALGNFDRALEAYEKVLPLFETLNRKTGISYALTNIGNIHYVYGDYGGALDRYQKSLAIEESMGDTSGIASSFANIGFVHRQQRNYDVALEFYQKSLNIREALGDKAGIANTLNYIANVHYRQGHHNKALEFFNTSLELKQSLGDKAGIVSSLYGIGQFHHSQNDEGRALDFYQKSLALAESTGSKQWIATVLIGIAESRCSQGSYEKALEAADRAAALAREIANREMLWDSLTVAGKAHRALNRVGEARRAFDEAINTIEDLRAQVGGSEQGRQRFFENKVAPYQEMVELLIAQNRSAEAFAYAERTKARALVDVLTGGSFNITKSMSSEEREQEQKLKTELTSVNSQISGEMRRAQPDSSRISALNVRLSEARLKYEAFQTGLYAVHPELRARRGDARTATASEAADLLPDANAALLQYVVTENKTYLFVVSKAKNANSAAVTLNTYSLSIKRKDLADNVAKFHQQLAKRDMGFRSSATQLYDLLLSPARADLQGKSAVVIAPDGVLWELPFQALATPQGRYVLEDYAISYIPSASVLREMVKLRKNESGRTNGRRILLAFGNATPEKQTVERVKTVHRDEKLDPLPEAEREVKTLAELYGDEHSRVYVGAEAREDRLKAEAGTFRVLHLATHGILNDASPMYSQIVLAQGPQPANEDGLLEAWEIMKLDLNADLVVLSACETGRGRVGAGEGLIGLAWALFVAGSPTSIVSQWKVDSKSTTELMIDFHRNLRAGLRNSASNMTKARALREAAMKLLRTNDYRHPFYWAGFVIIGNPG